MGLFGSLIKSTVKLATLPVALGLDVVTSGVAEFKASDVVYALDALNKLGQIAGYNVGIKEFNLGCQTFTIADLIAVDKAFKDFQ